MREVVMHMEHVVIKIQVDHEGRRHAVSSFLEAGTIHAHVDGRMLMLPVSDDPPADTVAREMKAMLMADAGRSFHLHDDMA